MDEKIDYIEVSIYDCGAETTGLLTHFGIKSGRVRLLTDSENTNELFDLAHYTITRILIGKSSTNYDTVEQYIFKNDDDDQDTAKTVIINQLKILEKDDRTTVSGFITKDTFTNLPDKYVKTNAGITAKSIVQNQRAATLGGNKSTSTTQGQTSVYHNNYQNNYQKRNTKTVSFIPRTSALPSKAFLKRMKAKVKAVAENTFEPEFPNMDGDPPSNIVTQADVDDAMYDVYGGMGAEGSYHPHDY